MLKPRCLLALFAAATLLAASSTARSDDFNSDSLPNWRRLFQVEGRSADPFEKLDVGQTRAGWLTITPRPNAWYQDYRGGLLFGEVEGDFLVTTHVRVSGRNGESPPQAAFSLAGLLVRAPRRVTPATWRAGEENFVFHTLGVADRPGVMQFQSMNTRNSQSHIDRRDAAAQEATLQLARIGPAILLLVRNADGAWTMHRGYARPDLPERLQVGLMAATDWPSVQAAGVDAYHRDGVAGRPDLMAQFDYVTLERLPSERRLRERLPQDPSAVSAADLAALLREAPNIAAAKPAPPSPTPPTPPSLTPPTPPASSPSPRVKADDDLAELSDEFDDPQSLANWRRVFRDEQSGADQLQSLDIGRTRPGWLTLVPYTSSWYRDWRGVLVHKRVAGDFVATARLRTARRGGDGPPRSPFSLAGILVRTPRDVTPRTWRAGGENYLFLSHGAADRPGSYQLEVKTTLNSDSQLQITPAAGAEAVIRVARLGPHFVLLHRNPDGPWRVHRRYHRPDMPRELQVGITVYTDWPNVERVPPAQHNVTVIRNGNPDLVAALDYFRFHRPQPPAELNGRAYSDAAQVSDEQLLHFLGAD